MSHICPYSSLTYWFWETACKQVIVFYFEEKFMHLHAFLILLTRLSSSCKKTGCENVSLFIHSFARFVHSLSILLHPLSTLCTVFFPLFHPFKEVFRPVYPGTKGTLGTPGYSSAGEMCGSIYFAG